jgi:hypothetical protein
MIMASSMKSLLLSIDPGPNPGAEFLNFFVDILDRLRTERC